MHIFTICAALFAAIVISYGADASVVTSLSQTTACETFGSQQICGVNQTVSTLGVLASFGPGSDNLIVSFSTFGTLTGSSRSLQVRTSNAIASHDLRVLEMGEFVLVNSFSKSGTTEQSYIIAWRSATEVAPSIWINAESMNPTAPIASSCQSQCFACWQGSVYSSTSLINPLNYDVGVVHTGVDTSNAQPYSGAQGQPPVATNGLILDAYNSSVFFGNFNGMNQPSPMAQGLGFDGSTTPATYSNIISRIGILTDTNTNPDLGCYVGPFSTAQQYVYPGQRFYTFLPWAYYLIEAGFIGSVSFINEFLLWYFVETSRGYQAITSVPFLDYVVSVDVLDIDSNILDSVVVTSTQTYNENDDGTVRVYVDGVSNLQGPSVGLPSVQGGFVLRFENARASDCPQGGGGIDPIGKLTAPSFDTSSLSIVNAQEQFGIGPYNVDKDGTPLNSWGTGVYGDNGFLSQSVRGWGASMRSYAGQMHKMYGDLSPNLVRTYREPWMNILEAQLSLGSYDQFGTSVATGNSGPTVKFSPTSTGEPDKTTGLWPGIQFSGRSVFMPNPPAFNGYISLSIVIDGQVTGTETLCADGDIVCQPSAGLACGGTIVVGDPVLGNANISVHNSGQTGGNYDISWTQCTGGVNVITTPAISLNAGASQMFPLTVVGSQLGPQSCVATLFSVDCATTALGQPQTVPFIVTSYFNPGSGGIDCGLVTWLSCWLSDYLGSEPLGDVLSICMWFMVFWNFCFIALGFYSWFTFRNATQVSEDGILSSLDTRFQYSNK